MQSENSQNPDYNFILQDKQAPKRSIVPGGLPRPIVYVGGGLIVLMLIILLFGLLFSRKSPGTTNMIEVTGKAQEINRVSQAEAQQLKDPDAISLAATTQASLQSDQTQLTQYLAKRHVKVSPKNLVIYKDSSTDDKLKSATQNNNLDATYLRYLKQALTDYSAAVKTAYASTSSPTAKVILKDSYASTQVLLAAPQLARN